MEKYLKDEPRLTPSPSSRTFLKQLPSPTSSTKNHVKVVSSGPASACFQNSPNSVPKIKQVAKNEMATEMILILLFYTLPGIMWQKEGVIARKAISLK